MIELDLARSRHSSLNDLGEITEMAEIERNAFAGPRTVASTVRSSIDDSSITTVVAPSVIGSPSRSGCHVSSSTHVPQR
jgi:hypothetical protein